MPDLIFRFVFRDDAEIEPIFMWKLLTTESQRKAIQALASGAAGSMPNISKTNLKEVLLPIPPHPLQEKFTLIVKKVESLNILYQKSLADLETLYGALSQQAFKGELDLSRIKPLTQQTIPCSMKEQLIMPIPKIEKIPTIELPETNFLILALENRENLQLLLSHWLEVYLAHLGETAFSVEHFIVAAQTRLAERHFDNDFELGPDDYEYIKSWVFEALAAGKLTQIFDDVDNSIHLKAIQT